MWSVPEAEVVQPYRKQRIVGGYFPRPAPAPIQRAAITAGERVPVLVASAYLISAYGLELAVPVFSGLVAIAVLLLIRYGTARR